MLVVLDQPGRGIGIYDNVGFVVVLGDGAVSIQQQDTTWPDPEGITGRTSTLELQNVRWVTCFQNGLKVAQYDASLTVT